MLTFFYYKGEIIYYVQSCTHDFKLDGIARINGSEYRIVEMNVILPEFRQNIVLGLR